MESKKKYTPWNKGIKGYSTSLKGRKLSEEHKRKIGLANKGFKHSEETKEKIRKLKEGKPCYAIRGINNPSKRPEVREKLSLSKLGDKNPRWNGGRYKEFGYVLIYKPNHPYKNHHNCFLEHRLIMEEHLGRYLKPTEVVHHINGIRDDNRMENLRLFKSKGTHRKFHCKIVNGGCLN